jgi:D-3-phosphoglycerate dehydrogenase
MKPGACFLNLSRGFVVDHDALASCVQSGRISGAAVDVFPNEPEGKGQFTSSLQDLPNVIRTPHIGGSTEEAQQNIGQFVSSRLVDYLQTGNTMLSVNLPHCQLEHDPKIVSPHAHSPEHARDVVRGERGVGEASHQHRTASARHEG